MAADENMTGSPGRAAPVAQGRLPPIGFWSYARQDDELSQGKLSSLRSLLMFELQQQHGRDQIQIFQDARTIPHGAAWEREIKSALGEANFFIPIITPNFVQSDWCCREVAIFLEREAELQALYPDHSRRSRMFPIQFIDIEDVDAADPAALAALQSLQWFDFRKFRHRSYDSEAVREAIADLAASVRDLLKIRVSPGGGDATGTAPAAFETVEEVDAPETSRAPTIILAPKADAGAAGSGAEAPPKATETARPIQVGDVLNHIFEVKRFIKAGGMGQVFEGCNVITGERVAIKALLPALAADPKVIGMLHRESITLTRLQHEALVQYRVLAREPELGVLYIVTDYIDGVDLGEVLDRVERTPAALAALLERLASGLAAAHRLGAIHRDISPDNVMLPDGDLQRAKIIDFGIAKDLAGTLPTLIGDGFAGKLSFVAPEQLGEHGGEIGSWTDVYSLALVILSVARGEKVDMAGSFADAIRKRRDGVDTSPAPETLRPLLADMLRIDPAERVRTMDQVLALLAEAVAAKPPVRGPADDAAELEAARKAAGREREEAARAEPEPRPEPEPEPEAVDWAIGEEEAGQSRGPARWMPWLAIGMAALAILLLWRVVLAPGPSASPASPERTPDSAPSPSAPAAGADRSWLYGRWCVDGDQNNVQTLSGAGNRLVTVFSGRRRQTETVTNAADGSLRTNIATYTRNPDRVSVTVVEQGYSIQLRRCR